MPCLKSVGNLPDANDSLNNTGRDIEMSLAAIFRSERTYAIGTRRFVRYGVKVLRRLVTSLIVTGRNSTRQFS